MITTDTIFDPRLLDDTMMVIKPTADDLERHWLIDARSIVVDIETNTKDPTGTWGNKIGLTYMADLLAVSFHVDGYPTVAMLFPEGEAGISDVEREFIVRVLTNKELIIGHNVVFDLRILGGHLGFNFLTKIHPNIWDTMIMSTVLMMSQNPDETSLASLAAQYNLVGDTKAQAFYAAMKAVRAEITISDNEEEMGDLLRYVCMDTQVTHRLYQLQRMVIETESDKTAEPTVVWDEVGSWKIVVNYPTDRINYFVSTKNWKNLREIVAWEQRKLWIASTMAIRGIKLDTEYLQRHRQQLLGEYAGAMTDVMNIIYADPTHDQRTQFLMPFAIALWHWQANDKLPTMDKWVYAKVLMDSCGDQPMPEIGEFWHPGVDLPDDPENNSGTALALITVQRDTKSLNFDFVEWLYLRTPVLHDDLDGRAKAKLKALWYEHFLTLTKPLDDGKLINKTSFQPWYVFGIRGVPFPTNEQLKFNPYLVTPKVKAKIDRKPPKLIPKAKTQNPAARELLNDTAYKMADILEPVDTTIEMVWEPDYRAEAMELSAWSMSEDAFNYHFKQEEGEPPADPLMLVMHHMAHINRIDEFLKHAKRDGRIHSVVAPKASTGRATHVTPNLGNLPMKLCKGYLVCDDPSKYVQFSIDISNAENFSAAMTFGDNILAEACVASDFHWRMMEIYDFTGPDGKLTPEYIHMMDEIAKGTDEGHKFFKMLKDRRKSRKSVTFGTAYGMGAPKLSVQLGITYEEAQALIDAKERAFSKMSEGKQGVIDRCQKLFDQGYRPPFVVLWTGRRVTIPLRAKSRPDGSWVTVVEGYKGINYLQQGAVAEIVWRAMILAQEELLERGMDAWIAGQVHDEIIGQCLIEDFWEVAQIIIKYIYEIVPEDYRNRTLPAVRFLAAIGPENASKWGYQDGVTYPVDKTKFANYWGVWDMPEGADEAPTWPGPVHEGYTLEREIADRTIQAAQDALNSGDVSVNGMSMWSIFNTLQADIFNISDDLMRFRQPVSVTLNEQERGPFMFPERMAIYQALAARGHDVNSEYWEAWKTLGAFVDRARDMIQWWQAHAPVQTPRETAMIEEQKKLAEQRENFNSD